MRIKTIALILGAIPIAGLSVIAESNSTLYTSGDVAQSQFSSIAKQYVGLEDAEQDEIDFEEELAALRSTSASKLIDSNSKYVVYYNADGQFNVKAVNTGNLKATTIRNAMQTAGIKKGEFLIIGLTDSSDLGGFADAIYAYKQQGGSITQKNLELAVEELTIANKVTDPDNVIKDAKFAAVDGKNINDELAKYDLDNSTLEGIEAWALSYADVIGSYSALELSTIDNDSILVTADDAYLGDNVNISVTYNKPEKRADSMFSCFKSKKKKAETEVETVVTPSTEKVEISSDMIPDDTEAPTEKETKTETEIKTETETERVTETTNTEGTESPVDVVEDAGRSYDVIPKDDSYKSDGLSEYERSQDESASNSSASSADVTVVGKSDSKYDTEQYAASKDYKDDFSQNLLE